jgi:putative PEP-CTERM system histidine kinase
MLLILFLAVATALNLGLGIAVQLRRYQRRLGVYFLGVSLMICAHLWVAWAATSIPWLSGNLAGLRLIFCLDLVISFGLLQVSRHFFHSDDGSEAAAPGFAGRVPWIWLYGANALALAACVAPTHFLFATGEGGQLTLTGSVIPAAMLLNTLASLFLLENTYRFAEEYQRRIGRLVFIGLFWVCGFHVLAFGRALLYSAMHPNYIEASSVVYGVVFPVVLLGFLRYRLGTERISIPRDTIYSSVTLFMTGAAFLAVAVTVFVFEALNLDFNQFELYLGGFSLCFIAVLALGSGTMRRRISRFVNARLYSTKFDYQEQFFRLHQSMATEGDVGRAVTDLIENMKYSVAVDDALCFLRNPQDGDFYAHQNKESAFRGDLKLSGDSPLVRVFETESIPLDFLAPLSAGGRRVHEARGEPLLLKLRLDAAFAIRAGDELVGILALQGGRKKPLDAEEFALIGAFATSIANVVFKSRVLEARIEQKQFESFHHIASFIIHDIKNQIATLNLLLRNADRNIENPAFQRSMLTSVRSSAEALQGLIDRLAVAPRQHEIVTKAQAVQPVLEEVAQSSGLREVGGLQFTLAGDSIQDEFATADFDRQSLFFVVKNLCQNALEAMGNQGRLALRYGGIRGQVPEHVRAIIGGGGRFFAGFGAYVLVSDTGPGMDPEFLRTRLFQPFATTKEKGVGIGLYQCRTMMEKMGGRIICQSRKGEGTTFCLLLRFNQEPSADQ